MGVVIRWQDLGSACQQRRRELGWSAEALAKAAGVHRTTIYRLEACRPVSVATLNLILEALGWELRYAAGLSVLCDVAPN